jgi:hypothetical protein
MKTVLWLLLTWVIVSIPAGIVIGNFINKGNGHDNSRWKKCRRVVNDRKTS